METEHQLGRIAAGALLTTATLALVPAAAGAAGAATCSGSPWPAAAESRPAVHPAADGVDLWRTARGWHLRVNDPGVVGFRFVNHGGVDGLDFVTRCASTVSARVKVDGTTVPADHVFIGADGHHPGALPTTGART